MLYLCALLRPLSAAGMVSLYLAHRLLDRATILIRAFQRFLQILGRLSRSARDCLRAQRRCDRGLSGDGRHRRRQWQHLRLVDLRQEVHCEDCLLRGVVHRMQCWRERQRLLTRFAPLSRTALLVVTALVMLVVGVLIILSVILHISVIIIVIIVVIISGIVVSVVCFISIVIIITSIMLMIIVLLLRWQLTRVIHCQLLNGVSNIL